MFALEQERCLEIKGQAHERSNLHRTIKTIENAVLHGVLGCWLVGSPGLEPGTNGL